MFAANVELLGLAMIPLFLTLDLVVRSRKFDAPRGWRVRALLVSAFNLVLATWITIGWGTLLEGHSLFELSGLGIVVGSIVGIVVYEFFHYWYHRLAHGSDLVWRWAHQMHHSAESLDAFGANYGHPLDVLAFTTCSSLVFFPLLGLSPEAGAVGGAFLLFNAMFQHANIRTPRWLGYFIQRPESHSVHHGRGIHRYNYSDLPLWDMVFGTFHNPQAMADACGFWSGASSRIGAMLVGRDVSEPTPSRETTADSPRQLSDAA